jgi:hypothetical protein
MFFKGAPMGLAFVGRDGILRADWQSAHRSFGPPMKMKTSFPTLVESISYAVFQGSVTTAASY